VSASLLIPPKELSAALSDPTRRVLLLDGRSAESFAAGHLVGAVNIDLWGFSLIDTDPGPLHSFVWMIEHVLGLRGVSGDVPIVVYGETSDLRAARLFWFLEYFGHPDTRVLDGGFEAWRRAGLPVTTEAVAPAASSWVGGRHDERLATWRDVLERVRASTSVVLDTRSDGEYCGTTVRAARGGAIPGAVHIEWTRNLAPDGTFKPTAELRAMYEAAGITPDREVVTYCQGGYRAAHSYLALRVLGYPRVRNYLGSWKEWGDRADLPVEVPSQSGRSD
jgi:thiosulfate/3-mercaptopyruvate sulfurtransferase